MKLTDLQIRDIFKEFARRREKAMELSCPESLYHYARSIELCTLRDFMILRPTSLILIAKYNLGKLLPEVTDVAVHNFPGRSA